ncbi:MAG: hypothetical protein ACHQDB_07290 [Steroidobacterales bacterium]
MRHTPTRCIALSALFLVHDVLGADANSARLLSGLVQQAVSGRQQARLPPHLSVLLGISVSESATPVWQLSRKSSDALRLFNICEDNHDNIVLTTMRADKQSAAYLMSAGILTQPFDSADLLNAVSELNHAGRA